jgi:hypothetical protein
MDYLKYNSEANKVHYMPPFFFHKKCTIDVAGKNSSQHIEVYWMLKDKRSKNLLTPMANHPNEYDADRYFALINNNKDTIIIQRGTFEKIFRSCYEFFTPDEEQ